MKVSSLKRVGKRPVFDITVDGVNEYVLENGVITHNTGPMYSANNVFIVGKRQIKEGSEILGWQFILNVEKSRTIREKSAIPFEVTYEDGINVYSGLLDLAKITGHVVCPKMGWYTRPSVSGDKNWRRADTNTALFWDPLLENQEFLDAVKSIYALESNPLLSSSMDQLMGEQVPDDGSSDIEVEQFPFDPDTGEIIE